MSSRWLVLVFITILIAPAAFAISRTCTRSLDPPRIDQSTRLCADNYYSAGISITADNIILDCGTGVLKGNFKNAGITVRGRKHITIKNCQIANYDAGILVKNSQDITVLDSSLLRNLIGIKIIDSSGVVVENSMDVSITKPVQVINAVGNVFHFINKKLEGDQCRLNQCNQASGIATNEHALAKAEMPKKSLRRALNDSIRAWLGA